MIKDQTVLAIILARGGSKRVPGKNIRPVFGKPLIAWSIEAAKKSKYIDRIIISTDDNKIAQVAKKFGAEAPFIRPPVFSSDTATSVSAILHTLNWIKKNENKKYDLFILLQPTSPLRTSQQLDESLENIADNNKAYTLISVTKVNQTPFWMKTINKQGFIEDFLKDEKSGASTRSQDLPTIYIPNGAIYIAKTNIFLKSNQLYTEKTIPFIMDRVYSADIDEEADFDFAEAMFQLISSRNTKV